MPFSKYNINSLLEVYAFYFWKRYTKFPKNRSTKLNKSNLLRRINKLRKIT